MTIIIPTMPVESPEKAVLAQPEQESVLIAHPAESLILENRDGQWVRIPTGTHLPISPRAEVSGPSDAAFRHPLSCPLLFSCFAMDTKKKFNDTWSKGLIFTPVRITGALGRGPEESRLLSWMSLQA